MKKTKEQKNAEKLKKIQDNCDHDWDAIGSNLKQCTYPECNKVAERTEDDEDL